MRKLALVVLLCSSCLFSQTQSQVEKRQSNAARPPAAAATKPADSVKAQQRERGLRLLQIAEAQASGLQGAMRAYMQLQLARAYAPTDKAKAIELLASAFGATTDIPTDGTVVFAGELQKQILRELVPLAPQQAEELMAQMQPGDRESVLQSLLRQYVQNKNFDHAIELVYRIGQEKEIPYSVAGGIMESLPPERNGDFLQLFTVAYGSYRDHGHPNASVGNVDFANLVVRFWPRLPASLVRDAIHELLKQAATVKGATLNMSSDIGSASFGSYYDYRLFELLPVLRQVDETEAEDLLKKNQELQAMLTKYPQGTVSLDPAIAGPASAKQDQKKTRGTSYSIQAGPGAGAPLAAQSFQEQQARTISVDAKDPDIALAQAGQITDLSIRAGMYELIARTNLKKNPTVAHNALEKLLAIVDQLDFSQGTLRSAAELYLQMGDTDNAKRVVERGFKLADKLFDKDTNADDPNKALKAYWPSAEAYRSFTRLAAQISPEWALNTVNEISDPEMKAVVTTALAQGWLGVSRGTTIVQINSKSQQSMMMSTEGPKE